MKKFLASFLCVVLLCTSFALPVMAATTQKVTAEQGRSGVAATTIYSHKITVSNKFKTAWKTDTTINIMVSGIAYPMKVVYGFDKFATNEDYVNKVGGMPTGCMCQGTVINSKGVSKSTGYIQPGKLSGKKDVKHEGTSAAYKFSMYFGNK